MKKTIFLSILFWLVFVGFSFGQQQDNIEDIKTVSHEVSLNMAELWGAEINNIRWKFCTDNKWWVKAELKTNLRPNELKKLCFVLWNDVEENYQIASKVLPTTLDAKKNIVCKTKLDTWDQQIIDSIIIDEIKEINLTWKSHVIKTIQIKPPKNYSWELSFCLNYEILNAKEKYAAWWMFKIRSVKSNKWFINVTWSNYPELFNIAKYNKNFWYTIMWIIVILLIYYTVVTIKEEKNKKHKKTHKKQ